LNECQNKVLETVKELCMTSIGTPWEAKAAQRKKLLLEANQAMQGKKTPDELVDALCKYIGEKQSDAEFTGGLRTLLPAMICMNLHVPMQNIPDLEAWATECDRKAEALQRFNVDAGFIEFVKVCTDAARAMKAIKDNEDVVLNAEIVDPYPDKFLTAWRNVGDALANKSMEQYRTIPAKNADGVDLYCKDVEKLKELKNKQDGQLWIPSEDTAKWIKEFDGRAWTSNHAEIVKNIQVQLIALQEAEKLDGTGDYDKAQKKYYEIKPLTWRIAAYRNQRVERDMALCDPHKYTVKDKFKLFNPGGKWDRNGFVDTPSAFWNESYGEMVIYTTDEQRCYFDWSWDKKTSEISITPSYKQKEFKEVISFKWSKNITIHLALENKKGERFGEGKFAPPHALNRRQKSP
jgi:hypothetical protein